MCVTRGRGRVSDKGEGTCVRQGGGDMCVTRGRGRVCDKGEGTCV